MFISFRDYKRLVSELESSIQDPDLSKWNTFDSSKILINKTKFSITQFGTNYLNLYKDIDNSYFIMGLFYHLDNESIIDFIKTSVPSGKLYDSSNVISSKIESIRDKLDHDDWFWAGNLNGIKDSAIINIANDSLGLPNHRVVNKGAWVRLQCSTRFISVSEAVDLYLEFFNTSAGNH